MIHVRDFTYFYPETTKPALENLSLTVQAGECLGIVGQNGAGKSTLCYALMGLIPHFYRGELSGTVTVDGIDVSTTNMGTMSQHVGLVFQNPANQLSGAKLTVAEEIAFGLEHLGVDRETMHQRIEWVTRTLGIHHLADRNPYALSGGQMQRVAIASVLALKPKVLILDEPTSQLDPAGTKEVFSTIDILREEGVTVVIVEHKMSQLSEHCTRLCVLNAGRLKIAAEPRRVFEHPDLSSWGIRRPRYVEAFHAVEPGRADVPATLSETIERLRRG